jgi:CO dehydrogenase/acetyl-CoA synthase beta subunit
MPESGRLRKSASQRQQEYITRQRDRGYVLLTGLWIPATLKDRVRDIIKDEITKFEASVSQL